MNKTAWDDALPQQLDAIHKKLDRLDDAIRGNGKLGILVRLDRLEQIASHQHRMQWMVYGTIWTAMASGILAWALGMGWS